jgi:hypothetical protein
MSFSMVGKHKTMFPIVSFLTHQILGIVGSQIEMQKIFLLASILTKLMRCHLQLNNLERLIFVRKKWPDDFRIDSKPPSNLVELIEKDLDFEEFEKLESSFEQDGLVNI